VPAAVYGLYDFKTDTNFVEHSQSCNGWTLGTADVLVQGTVGSTIAYLDSGMDLFPRFVFLARYDCDAAGASDSHLLCAAFNKVP